MEPTHHDRKRFIRQTSPSAMLAAPAFLVILLAAYGLARGLAEGLAPLDRWIDRHVMQPAQAGADSHQDGP